MPALAPAEQRVLFVVDKSGFGGIQTIAYTLMNQQFPPHIRMSFFFIRNINAWYGMQEVDRENVHYSAYSHRYDLMSLRELFRLIRELKITILHMNGNKSIIWGALAKTFFPHVKVIAHEHGGVFDNRRTYLWLIRSIKNRIDAFVSLSRHRKEILVSRCAVDPARIQILYNFIDPARVRRSLPSSEAALEDGAPFVIGYLGGLSRIKGCDVLLRAVAIIKGQISGFKVTIAGDGPAKTELEALAGELDLLGEVSFIGYVNNPGPVYAGFDLMVIPSRSEAGPMCLYEGWTMNLPVIASNAKVLDELIEDGVTGLLFRSEDEHDLAEKILQAYHDKALAETISAGGSREALKHSVDHYLLELQDLYGWVGDL